MEYRDIIDSTVLTVTYDPVFKATRFHVLNKLKTSERIDLSNDNLLRLVNQLNEIIENEKKDL